MALTQVDQGLLGQYAQYTGFKNRIINGAMVIDQRNAGTSVTYNGSSGYSVDRFAASEIGDGAFTLQQVADAPVGFVNSLKMTVTTPQTGTLNAGLYQAIEGYNISDLNWGTANAAAVTLSFWVKSSVTGAMGGAIQNSAGDRSYPFNYTVNTANTWEQKTITIAGDTSGTWLTTNGTGLLLRFMYGTSLTGAANTWASANYRAPTGSVFPITTSGATFYITGVQLEKGSTATSFDYRPYGTELQLCQRYYETSYNYGVAVGSNNSNGRIILSGSSQASNLCLLSIPYKVSKRTNATATLYSQTGTASTWDYERSGVTSTATPVAYEGGTQGTNVYINVGSAWVSCTTYGHFAVSAEL